MEFSNYNMEEQVHYLSKLAEKAVEAYSIGNAQIQLIQHQMNTVFKVTDTENSSRYVLRIQPEHWLPLKYIQSEMIFLERLAQEGELLASIPVRAKDGSFVQEVAIEEVPVPRYCVLLKWVDGNFCEDRVDADTLLKAGEYLGRLHKFGSTFQSNDEFQRPRKDMEGLFGESGLFSRSRGEAAYTEADKELFSRVEAAVNKKLNYLGQDENQFGLIHGDFYFRNYLVQDGRIGAIDFDLCGWGYYYYDILAPYWPDKQGNIEEALSYFLKGYRRVRRLSDEIIEYKDTFHAVRRLIDIYYTAGRTDHPEMVKYLPYIKAPTIEILKQYLEKNKSYT